MGKILLNLEITVHAPLGRKWEKNASYDAQYAKKYFWDKLEKFHENFPKNEKNTALVGE